MWSVSCRTRHSGACGSYSGLEYSVIDVSTGCDLSLVARDTVALAVEKLKGTSSPSLTARVSVAPAIEKLTDTSLVQVHDE